MGINPKNRDDMFLAKAAGEEVDLTSITPPTAVSDREKLLVKLGERLDNIDGGGSTEIIVAPEQIVELTGNEDSGAEVLLADGLSIEWIDSSNATIVGDNFEGNTDFSKCSVSVNGIALEWNSEGYVFMAVIDEENVQYVIWPENNSVYLWAEKADGTGVIPGKYTVKITAAPVEEEEGSPLPEVTADDNGKVLSVVDGVWNKAEPSTGGLVTLYVKNVLGTGSNDTTLYWDEAREQHVSSSWIRNNLLGYDDNTGSYNPIPFVIRETDSHAMYYPVHVAQTCEQIAIMTREGDIVLLPTVDYGT